MSRRSRPQYRPGLEWILGVAFPDTLTRPVRLAQGITFRSVLRFASDFFPTRPHGASAGVSRRRRLRAVASGSRLLPSRPAKDFHLQSTHARHTRLGLRPPSVAEPSARVFSNGCSPLRRSLIESLWMEINRLGAI